MKGRPILFSGEMVKAILAGEKTQTRRIMVSQPKPDPHGFGWIWESPRLEAGYCHTDLGAMVRLAEAASPYGRAGDRLWVRETLRETPEGSWYYAADEQTVTLPKSDPRIPAMLSWAHHKKGSTCVSIHMPRWASRILLEVTAIRVERLQDITEKDAEAEGIDRENLPPMLKAADSKKVWPIAKNHRELFAMGWDCINGKRAPWASNPFVYVVCFKPIEAP